MTSPKGRILITGDLKSKVDEVWDAFWSGGIANPLDAAMVELDGLLTSPPAQRVSRRTRT